MLRSSMEPHPIVVPRRAILVSLGLAAGALALAMMPAPVQAEAAKAPRYPQLPVDGGLTPNALVHVAPNGVVTVVVARTEIGQGIKSSIPALVADELGADLARVAIVQADANDAYGPDQNTGGSGSFRGAPYDDLRRVGATARMMLIAAAAKRWRVPAAQCSAQRHIVSHAKSGRSLGFGELAAEAAKLPIPAPEQVTFRPTSEFIYVGRPLPLIGAMDIVTGRAIYGADVRLPNMLIAVIARPPVAGGAVASFDPARALQIPGVKRVVGIPPPKLPFSFQPLGGVAVIAENTWAALRGRAALEITWSGGPHADYDSGRYREELFASVRAPATRVRDVGDVDAAFAKAERRVVAEYYVPHLCHVPMEPPVSLAHAHDREAKCEVWTPTQGPMEVRDHVARQLGIEQKNVHVRVTLAGGSFGRKGKADHDREAAFLSHEMNAPVRVQWTREDDIRHDYFHAVSAQRMEAGLDGSGEVIAWLHRTAFPSIRSTFRAGWDHARDDELTDMCEIPLAIPNVRIENGAAKGRVRIGWLRSVTGIQHGFALGSFVDEIAYARGQDPKIIWLELLGPPRRETLSSIGVSRPPNDDDTLKGYPIDVGRWRTVIERATAAARWDERGEQTKYGRALGLASYYSCLTYVAIIAAVAKDAQGKLRVEEAWIAVDAGTIVNPDRVRAQFEGSFIFGQSLAFHGGITLKNGAVEQSNFHDQHVVRMPEAPRAIHVDLVTSSERPGGCAEPGVPPTAPAITNAIFALTGVRVRELPISRAEI